MAKQRKLEKELQDVLNLNRILLIVNDHPGKYSSTDLIRELRRSYINAGFDDLGLSQARKVVEQARETGRIDVRKERKYRVEVERCYPI